MNFFKNLFPKKENTEPIVSTNNKKINTINYAILNPEQKATKRKELIESPNPISVQELMELYTVEELCETAEDYYKNNDDLSGLLRKPYIAISETSELLSIFSQIINGIKPIGGMDILDFGAGPGWASHALSSLGAKMIISDVSASALKIVEERYSKNPIPGSFVKPKFLHFNGRKLNLATESIDRIICIDAFHHIPNPEEIISEMFRVLKNGGIAAFAEPGPIHSWSPGAQFEMRKHQVVENDIIIEDIWAMAKKTGFSDIKLALFNTCPFHVGLDEFNDFLKNGATTQQYLQSSQHYMQNSRRLFFLYKGTGQEIKDSRSSEGLKALIELHSGNALTLKTNEKLIIKFKITNIGSQKWLPASQSFGSVWLGVDLQENETSLTKTGYFTFPLPIEETAGLLPNKTVEFECEIPTLGKPGKYIYQFDLVSQQVAWFKNVGSATKNMEVNIKL